MIIRRINKYDRRKPRAEHLVNEAIPYGKIFLLDKKGQKLGITSKQNALQLAKREGLDLVIISSSSQQPVAKILDYGKFKYLRKRKRKEAKSKQTVIENKEIRITPMIGVHDLETKARKARQFLLEGHRLKVSLKFRGRELARKELGYEKQQDFLKYVDDLAKVDKPPKMSGHNFLDMYLSPDKKKISSLEKRSDNGKIKDKKSDNKTD